MVFSMILFASSASSADVTSTTTTAAVTPASSLKCNTTSHAECAATVCCVADSGVTVFGPLCQVTGTRDGQPAATNCRVAFPCKQDCADFVALNEALANASLSLEEKIAAFANESGLYDNVTVKASLSRKTVQDALGNLTGEANFAAFRYVKDGELSCAPKEETTSFFPEESDLKYCAPKECCGAKVLPTCVAEEKEDRLRRQLHDEDDEDKDEDKDEDEDKDADEEDEDKEDVCASCDLFCDADDDDEVERIATYQEITGRNFFLALEKMNVTLDKNDTDEVVLALRAGLNETTLEALEDADDYFNHAPTIGGFAVLCALVVAYV